MNTIKNIHKLAGIVPAADIEKLETGAAMHLRHANISFKIIKIFDNELHVLAEQGRHLSENYADKNTLVTRARELFEKFIPGKTIYIHAVPFVESPVNIVDPGWISKQMLNKGIKLKDITKDSGLNNTQLSAVISGDKPLSQIMKAFLYYYFAGK